MPETDANAALAVVDGAGPAANAEEQPAAAGNSMWSVVKGMFVRMAVIYFISSLMRNWRGPQGQLMANGTVKVPGSQGAISGEGGGISSVRPPGRNLFDRGTELDFYIYLSESELFHDFDNPDSLFWSQSDFVYGDWTGGPDGDGSYSKSAEIVCPPALQNNGSYYMHVFIVRAGNSPDPSSANYQKRYTIRKTRRLNKYKKKKYQKTANLLTGETDQTEEQIMKASTIKYEILSHWHPNLTINLVDDQTMWSKGSLPPPLDEYVEFDPITGDYYPIFFFNDYWNLGADYIALNDSVATLNLTITVAPMSLFKWQMYASQGMRNKWTQILGTDQGDESDDDQDSLKQAILETNPYLLGLTIAVSLLHTIFEFLAFKNDIQFWRSRKSLEGLSVRSVLFNMFTSGVVLLYIIDNETNFVVRISVGIGMLIEMWKIPKVMDVKVDWEHKIFGIIPRVSISDKGSYIESSTREYDILAFKYLSWMLYPLLGGYAVYSLIYHEHRGWYSFVLSMLYGFLLTFGFIMMTPQLFINYKLKSVAHLPWRMLSYKFLNTFIDDIFAFVIRMPTMYRIGCFRDDIVFLVYVYQRWIYRVDPTRVNEFGTSGEDHLGPQEGDPAAIDGGGEGALDAGNRVPADEVVRSSEEDHSSAPEDLDSGAEGALGRDSVEGGASSGKQTRQRKKRNRNKKSETERSDSNGAEEKPDSKKAN